MTDPTPASPALKSLQYVEDLGTHTVYEQAIEARDRQMVLGENLRETRRKRRATEMLLRDVEQVILEEERGKHPGMSQAALERHLKDIYHHNSNVIEAKQSLYILAGEIDDIDYQMSLAETDVKIAVARLHELGGLLQFMAVLKATNNANDTKTDGNPW